MDRHNQARDKELDHVELLMAGVDRWNEDRPGTPDLSGEDIYVRFSQAGKLVGHPPELPSLAGADFRNGRYVGTQFDSMFAPPGLDLRSADFRSADLRNAALGEAILDRASFVGAKLNDADLSGASLCEADLRNAAVGCADLSRADLSGASFTGTDLRDVNLSGAKLAGVDLSRVLLVGTSLYSTEPWLARLFPADRAGAHRPDDAAGCVEITSIGNMFEHCSTMGPLFEATGGTLYFRGESNSSWELRPSVMRRRGCAESVLRSRESEMLLEAMSRRPEDFRNATSALDQWVLAQHHGLKTRLLDVTRNPLVALLNACGGLDNSAAKDWGKCNGRVHVFAVPNALVKRYTSDTVSVIANFAKLARCEQDILLGREPEEPVADGAGAYRTCMEKLYHLIRQERVNFYEKIDPKDLFRVFVVQPQESFERIRAQSGAFLLSGFHERFERSEILDVIPSTAVYQHWTVEIPGNSKRGILEELAVANVTREAMLPSLDETAKAIIGRFQAG